MAIAKSKVSVYTDEYVWNHGHRPYGFGTWIFQIGHKKGSVPAWLTDNWFEYLGTYTEAKKAAIDHAADLGITFVKVLS